jgi:8-oxo-dGTP pyrophosphatase MutT (NUDIX family)
MLVHIVQGKGKKDRYTLLSETALKIFKDIEGYEMTGYMKSLRKYVGHNPLIQCGASVIILDADEKVLMIHRTDNDCWGFPGGGVELGESVEDTAIREVFEETGLDIDEIKLFEVFSGKEQYYKYPNGDEVYNIDIVYTSRSYSGEANTNDESYGFKFFSIDELPDMISPPVIPVVERFKEKYKAGDV